MRKNLLIAIGMLMMAGFSCSSRKKEAEKTAAPEPPVMEKTAQPAEEKPAVPAAGDKKETPEPALAEPAPTRDATPAAMDDDGKAPSEMLKRSAPLEGIKDVGGAKGLGALPAPASPPPPAPKQDAPRSAKPQAVGFHQMDEEEPTQE